MFINFDASAERRETEKLSELCVGTQFLKSLNERPKMNRESFINKFPSRLNYGDLF